MNFNIWTAEISVAFKIIVFFFFDKIDKYRGKQEVAATVLIQTIKYYENTKYTLRKGINKIRTIVMCLSSSRKCKIFSAQLKCTTNGISVVS
jgi:hypothetical protein